MKHLKYLLLFIGLIAAGPASAATWAIDDTYIGGGYKNTFAHGEGAMAGDVIAANSGNESVQAAYINQFDIDNMTVEISDGGHITITIVTDYKSGTQDTDYGDLFISIDGWDENLTSTYTTTATGWEYVFDSSTGNLYSLAGASSSAYLLSESFFGEDGSVGERPDSYYRMDQLVQIDANALGADALLSTGQEFDSDTYSDMLIYSFDLTDLGLSSTESYNLAFRWAMTCANDVIEGGDITWQPVPEPETMVLLGIGLLGLGALGRRKLAPVRIRSKKKS